MLPPDAEVQRLLAAELLSSTEGLDKLELSRALKNRLDIPMSGVGDLTRLVSAQREDEGSAAAHEGMPLQHAAAALQACCCMQMPPRRHQI